MSAENISLLDLLNLSIGTPQTGAVNFNALHVLLHAVLRHLDLQEVTARWADAHPGHRHPGEAAAKELQAGSEPQQRTVGSRIRTCEDGVTEALKLIQGLHDQTKQLKEEIQLLHSQQKVLDVQAEKASAVERCCHRVDVLETTVRSLSDSLRTLPKAEQLSCSVTWDVLHSALLQQESAAIDSAPPPPPRPPPPPPGSVSSSLSVPPARGSQDHQDSCGQSPAQAAPPGGRSVPLPECHRETVEVLRDLSRLRERFSRLGPRLAALEEGTAEDRAELGRLHELLSRHGSQEALSDVMDRLKQQGALLQNLSSKRDENQRLVSDMQKTFLQLRAQCEKQDGSSRRVQRHIEELFKATEELQDKKVDKLQVQTEIRVDQTSSEGKVSRAQLESATEQLGAAVQQLRDTLSVQEQDWQRAFRKLSTELDCKLSRSELEPLKKQLDSRWRSVGERLQAQEAVELDDAAVLRKQLVDRFHCLSCDRPVVKYSAEQHLVTLPSTPGFPAHRSVRPFTVYALEQFRQHYRSERMTGLANYNHFTVSRNCGGSHTVNPTNQRRHVAARPCTHGEVDVLIQSEEVDIVGLDGHIYKGRLNTPVVRNPENRLPTISTKEALCQSQPSRPMTSPEAGSGSQLLQHPPHHHNARNGQCSRSASSSGRDWAVPTTDCTSHNFATPDAVKHRADTPFDH